MHRRRGSLPVQVLCFCAPYTEFDTLPTAFIDLLIDLFIETHSFFVFMVVGFACTTARQILSTLSWSGGHESSEHPHVDMRQILTPHHPQRGTALAQTLECRSFNANRAPQL